ncbi:FAD/NAD(P)-binding oxidoreductase [Magnetospira sp. QH-2]|uniref:NAD(P)/FAD-dependent oxidoreductase n=1 Tax=Magnetospira sp. (strain QH-2) TaxID=1288970 RepID=UPI0005FA747F|nr:FAD/NAD(P)-binding oxidoreductase [Magnetospira sp. QH-2]
MRSESEVLVVGGGLSGLSAATALAEGGVRVRLIDRTSALGGNIHRAPNPGAESLSMLADHQRRWARIVARYEAQKERIAVRCTTRFMGIDQRGMALITGREEGANRMICPAALVLATGAVERVTPRPGWTLPGVMTVGGIQSQLKSTGRAPLGRIVLAGTGPMMLAVGAGLAKAGNPPLAIIEAAQPFRHPLQALGLPREYLFEAMTYMRILMAARVPLLSGRHVSRIEGRGSSSSLKVIVEDRHGRTRILESDLLGLHDGLRENTFGLDSALSIPVRSTGDCRELLGARAAAADGLRVGHELAAHLTGAEVVREPGNTLDRQRRAQTRLRAVYDHPDPFDLDRMPDDTVLCRCENRTLGDLRALGTATDRELRLLGRFAMGACQGRFCAEWVRRLTSDSPFSDTSTIGRPRWPVSPLSVQALIKAVDESEHAPENESP